MVSETPVSLSDGVNATTKKPASRSSSIKKNSGKIPKKIHKAEREKLKRDHMNVLFLELGKTLEPAHENIGKASILSDSIRLLRDLLAHVDCLRRENATLLSEAKYVTVEKNELKEDKSALEAQIEKLQSEIKDRVHSRSLWNLDPSQSQNAATTTQLVEDHLVLPTVDHASEPAPVVGHVFVMPLHHDLQACSKPGTAEAVSSLPSNVTRPHARYPSPSDSWPSHILAEQPKATQNAQHSSSSTNSSSSSRGD